MEIIASYLPQYFPIPENDLWHEPGFTEWTNVAKAKPLFPGHYQPHLPGELGFYDLRVHEVREKQASLAKEYGITSFCFWHYWFGNGKSILDWQIKETLESKSPSFPFCLGWANESWYGIYHGVKSKLLLQQEYPSKLDHENHFYHCLKAFQDRRYTKINNKPVFLIYKPFNLPDAKDFINLWQKLAVSNGLEGIYFIAQTQFSSEIRPLKLLGFDAINIVRLRDVSTKGLGPLKRIVSKLFKIPQVYSYRNAVKYLIGKEEYEENVIPTLIPNWDHSPRSGNRAMIYHNPNPKDFEHLTRKAKNIVKNKKNPIIFIKSWNEWGEGNYLEPDRKFKRAYLEALQRGLNG